VIDKKAQALAGWLDVIVALNLETAAQWFCAQMSNEIPGAEPIATEGSTD
jgi:hypothetical protein